jgi:hypothetical protein
MDYSEYHNDYNELISKVADDFGVSFAALASPTLSKQETVTFLYEKIKCDNKPVLCLDIILSMFLFLPRIIGVLLVMLYASLRHERIKVPPGAVYFRTWLVPNSFSNNFLRDDYFAMLLVDLSDKYPILVGYQSKNLSLINRFFRCNKQNWEILNTGVLSVKEIISLFCEYLVNGYVSITHTYFLNGRDVSKFINYSLLLDYLKLRSFQAFLDKRVCLRLRELDISAYVYVYENQSWEKAVCSAFKDTDIRVIGYQSSGFSPLFLNFFPTKSDARVRPSPDILLTVGDAFTEYMCSHAEYVVPVETFAALRFSYPTMNSRYIVKEPNEIICRRILYAFPVHKEQYAGIIADLVSVFGNSKVEVDLRFHPLYLQDQHAYSIDLPDNFNIIFDLDKNEINAKYDCVLFNDNSFGLESLLFGVKAYQYNRECVFIDDRFIRFELWNPNLCFKDLFGLRDSIIDGTFDKVVSTNKVCDYMNHLYKPYTKNALFFFENKLPIR